MTTRHFAAVAALGLVVIVSGIQLFSLAVDDAYITYSFARNLARTGRLIYHPTNLEFSISSPLYAVILGIGGRAGLPIPTLSNVLSVASIFGSSVYLMLLCYRHKKMWAAITAGLLLATSPMMWLALGLETSFFVLVVLAAFYHFDREQYVVAAVLAAFAILTRGDGVLVGGLLGIYYLIVLRRRVPWNAVVAFAIVLIPALLYLALSFGSPFPTTLETKQGQAAIGFSGFFPWTTIPQGLEIMLRGWLGQSFLYYLWLPLTLLGLLFLPFSRWGWGVVAWGVAQFASYVLLDVAPYTWYYAPLVPGAVLLVGLAIQELAGRVGRVWPQLLAGGVLLSCLTLAQVISLRAAVSGIKAEASPEAMQSKVLPNGGYNDLFRATGDWIKANTPRNATVAVNDVGIIGYYADRPMIDFLGILQSDVSGAMGRNDLFYTIPHYFPDYIVLGEKPIIYNISLHDDPWFTANYKPVTRLSTERFEKLGGSPLVVFQRIYDPVPLTEQPTNIELSSGMTMISYAIGNGPLRPGDWMRVRQNWHIPPSADSNSYDMEKVLHITTHLANKDGEVVSERSAANVRTDFYLGHWAEGEISPIYTTVALPNDLAPGSYRLQVQIVEKDQATIVHDLTTLTVGSGPER